VDILARPARLQIVNSENIFEPFSLSAESSLNTSLNKSFYHKNIKISHMNIFTWNPKRGTV